MQARVGEQQKRQTERERERHKESEMHGQRETAKRKDRQTGRQMWQESQSEWEGDRKEMVETECASAQVCKPANVQCGACRDVACEYTVRECVGVQVLACA